MMKKIFFITLYLLLLTLTFFMGYQYYHKDNILNDSIKAKLSLEKQYNATKKEVADLNTTLANNDKEKNDINNQIVEKQNNIKSINAEIASKKAEIQRRKEQQAKATINMGTGSRIAYLTFDDGPAAYTSKILDVLKEYNIKATFFVTGKTDDYSLNMYHRIVNEGHSIGNHTYHHNYKTVYSSVDAFDYSFNLLQTLILNTTGVTMSIMRFPGGSNNTASNNYSPGIMDTLTTKYRDLGYRYFDWNVSSGDAAPSGVTTTSVINNITNQSRSRSKAIILMHDTMSTSPSALPTIIQNLSSMGFKFMSLDSTSFCVQFK